MRISTILFDLDGTLLPMDEDIFIKAYFKGLAKKLAPHGYDPEQLVAAVWKGTAAMTANDGSIPNEEAFWRSFTDSCGPECRNDIGVFEEFYQREFQEVQSVCGFDPSARTLVTALREMGLRIVLATNPLFPRIATESRVGWAGLSPNDFAYITTYENSCHCKPNPAYYGEILSKLELRAEECVMVGNNVEEDMVAGTLGMRTFLCPACLINRKGVDYSAFPQGTLLDCLAFIKTLV